MNILIEIVKLILCIGICLRLCHIIEHIYYFFKYKGKESEILALDHYLRWTDLLFHIVYALLFMEFLVIQRTFEIENKKFKDLLDKQLYFCDNVAEGIYNLGIYKLSSPIDENQMEEMRKSSKTYAMEDLKKMWEDLESEEDDETII